MGGWGELLGGLFGNIGANLINSAVKPGGIKKNFLPTFGPTMANMAGMGLQSLANYGGQAFDNWWNTPTSTPQNPYGQKPPNPYPYGQKPPNPYPYGQVPPNPYPYGQVPPNPYPYGQVPPNPLPRQEGAYLPNTNIPTQGDYFKPQPQPQPQADPSQWKDFAQQHPNTDAGWRAWDLKNWEQEKAVGLEDWFKPQRPGQQRPPLDRSSFFVPTTPSYGYGSDDFVNPKPLPPYNPNISPDFLKPLDIPGEKPYIPQSGNMRYSEPPDRYRPSRKY